jgi:hypothetical protein
MSKPVDALMRKEMTRKEFLLTLGLAMASIFGFSTIIRLLTGHSFERHANSYNPSPYGNK